MREFLTSHLVHVVALATLVSRLGDIGTTFLVTPTLKVEANPIVRRFRWRYAIATLAVALIPYYSLHGGIIVFTISSLIAALNASEAMLARSVGEVFSTGWGFDFAIGTILSGGALLIFYPIRFFSERRAGEAALG